MIVTPLDDYLSLLETYAPTRPVYSWVRFHKREMTDRGFHVEVRRYGDRDRGAIAVKFNSADGEAVVLVRVIVASDGSGQWLPVHRSGHVSCEIATGHLERLTAQDPDLWILETAAQQRREREVKTA